MRTRGAPAVWLGSIQALGGSVSQRLLRVRGQLEGPQCLAHAPERPDLHASSVNRRGPNGHAERRFNARVKVAGCY